MTSLVQFPQRCLRLSGHVVLQAQPRKYGEDYLVRGGALHAQGDLPSLRQQSFGFRHARSLPSDAVSRQLWRVRTFAAGLGHLHK